MRNTIKEYLGNLFGSKENSNRKEKYKGEKNSVGIRQDSRTSRKLDQKFKYFRKEQGTQKPENINSLWNTHQNINNSAKVQEETLSPGKGRQKQKQKYIEVTKNDQLQKGNYKQQQQQQQQQQIEPAKQTDNQALQLQKQVQQQRYHSFNGQQPLQQQNSLKNREFSPSKQSPQPQYSPSSQQKQVQKLRESQQNRQNYVKQVQQDNQRQNTYNNNYTQQVTKPQVRQLQQKQGEQKQFDLNLPPTNPDRVPLENNLQGVRQNSYRQQIPGSSQNKIPNQIFKSAYDIDMTKYHKSQMEQQKLPKQPSQKYNKNKLVSSQNAGQSNPYISLTQSIKYDSFSNFSTLLQTTVDQDNSWDNRLLGGTTDISLLMQNKGVQVMKYLYIGGQAAEENESFILAKNITHILQVGEELTQTHDSNKIRYMRVNIKDNKTEDIVSHLQSCFRFINEARSHGQSVLVHCLAGISRSATVCIAYMMYRKKVNFDEAFRRIKRRRQGIKPNQGFINQLKELDRLGLDFNKWQSTNASKLVNDQKQRNSDQLDMFVEDLQQDSEQLSYNGFNL